jgi:hypothetical protein
MRASAGFRAKFGRVADSAKSRESEKIRFMTDQCLIEARDQLLGFAHQQFASNMDVVGLFLAGSLAAGGQDAYSDIDLRVVVKPDKHQWFVDHRRDIARSWPGFLFNWPGFLFNEWRHGT